MQRRLGLLVVLAVFLTSAAAAAPQDEREKNLPPHHLKWLKEEVVYIISDVERETFLQLESEQEREAFVDAFWRKRDENPSTPENEYRIEHYERLAYANEFFGRDTFRKGWQTDRGRYYILLGPPLTRTYFDAKDEVYPAELWFYNSPELKRYGLPPFFFLLYFRRNGNGELKLYSPVADGPRELLTGYQTTSMDFRDDVERAYNTLFEVDPELAQASLSFRTDEGDTAQFQSVPFGTLELMEQITNLPFYGLDTSYAERLDFEKGSVESDYLFTYVPSHGSMSIVPGPDKTFYLHWVVELDAQYVALIRNEDRGVYATVFIASIEVTPHGDTTKLVQQFRKESFMTLNDSQAQSSLRRPFSYAGMTPLVPGNHDVRVILRNRACPGREEDDCVKSYTLLDSQVTIPEWPETEPALGDIIVGYGREPRDGKPLYRPFRFGNEEVLPNPRLVYAIGDEVIASVAPINPPSGSRLRFQIFEQDPVAAAAPRSEAVLEQDVPLDGVTGPVTETLSLMGFSGGRFELVATLLDGSGAELASRRSSFSVSPRTSIARPAVRGSVPQVLPEVPGLVAMSLADQYFGLEDEAKARELLEKAVAANPKLGPARERLAMILMAEGNAARVVELLEPVYAEVQDRFELLATLGEAYLKQQSFDKAVELLEKAIVLRRPEAPLLNMLAVSHYQSGNLDRALELLERSLLLDAEQPSVKEMLEELRTQQARKPAPPF